VRKAQWKLVLPHDYRSYENNLPGNDGWPGKVSVAKTGLALYDLSHDPGERYDVKELYPDIVTELNILADEMRKDLGDENYGIVGANSRKPGSIK